MSGARGDEQFADEAALRPGLFRDEHLAEHRLGFLENFVRGLAKLHAALKAALERALAASAGVDLRFHDDEFLALGEKLFGDRLGRFGRVAHFAGRDGDAVLRQKLFGLVFVNVH